MLENKAGVPEEKIVYCHGNLEKCHCLRCSYTAPLSVIASDIVNGIVPICPACTARGEAGRTTPPPEEAGMEWYDENYKPIPFLPLPAVLRPNIVFFGENLHPNTWARKEEDFPKADLAIVMGTSILVQPVSSWVQQFGANVPQILINRDIAGPRDHFDINILGNLDTICIELARRLGWADFVDTYAAKHAASAPKQPPPSPFSSSSSLSSSLADPSTISSSASSSPSSPSSTPSSSSSSSSSSSLSLSSSSVSSPPLLSSSSSSSSAHLVFIPFVPPDKIVCEFETPNITRVHEFSE